MIQRYPDAAAGPKPHRWRPGSRTTGGSRTSSSTSWPPAASANGRARSRRPGRAAIRESVDRQRQRSTNRRRPRSNAPTPTPALPRELPATGPSRRRRPRQGDATRVRGDRAEQLGLVTQHSQVAARSTATRPGSCPKEHRRIGASASLNAPLNPVTSARSVSSRATPCPITPLPSVPTINRGRVPVAFTWQMPTAPHPQSFGAVLAKSSCPDKSRFYTVEYHRSFAEKPVRSSESRRSVSWNAASSTGRWAVRFSSSNEST